MKNPTELSEFSVNIKTGRIEHKYVPCSGIRSDVDENIISSFIEKEWDSQIMNHLEAATPVNGIPRIPTLEEAFYKTNFPKPFKAPKK